MIIYIDAFHVNFGYFCTFRENKKHTHMNVIFLIDILFWELRNSE